MYNVRMKPVRGFMLCGHNLTLTPNVTPNHPEMSGGGQMPGYVPTARCVRTVKHNDVAFTLNSNDRADVLPRLRLRQPRLRWNRLPPLLSRYECDTKINIWRALKSWSMAGLINSTENRNRKWTKTTSISCRRWSRSTRQGTLIVLYIHCVSKKQDTKLLPITSPNVNRFSKFFHWQTHW